MRHYVLLASMAFLFIGGWTVLEQARPAPQSPVGPVVPRRADTVQSAETALDEQLSKTGQADKLWNASKPETRKDLLRKVEKMKTEIQDAVGPVVPRPLPPQPQPQPTQPNPKPAAKSPRKEDWDAALEELHKTLVDAGKEHPDIQLQPGTVRELQGLIRNLEKGKP
jgi:hypothetical protein